MIPAMTSGRRAYFTQEYAVESVAICNPSIVLHPDQSEVGPGDARFVLRLRAVGEGHRSSIEFRTGVIACGSELHFDAAGAALCKGRAGRSLYRRDVFHRVLRSLGDDGTSAAFVLDSLPDPFTGDELEHAVGALHDQLVTRRDATETIDRIRWVASSNYAVTFPTASTISERVLCATAPVESHGPKMSATATSRTSSTPAERCCTATPLSSPMGSRTPTSASPPSPWTSSSTDWASRGALSDAGEL
jgi:hypothetical protein